MLDTSQSVTLITVTHPICGVFIERFPPMLKFFTNKNQVKRHIVVVNVEDPNDLEFEARVERAFRPLPWPVEIINTHQNRWDLPAVNDVAPIVDTDWFIIASPDIRLLEQNWISDWLSYANEGAGIVGAPGPAKGMTPEAALRDPDWGWVGRLLLDRGLDFDETHHVQTWCCLIQTRAFKEIGGFWEPPDHIIRGKGDVITAEIYFSVMMRRCGYETLIEIPWMHHYGTKGGMAQLDELDLFDRQSGFPEFG